MAEERKPKEDLSDLGSDSINPFAVLGIGEALIRYCNGIRIKDHPFYVVLSNKRIILMDTYADHGVVAKEISLHTISDVERDPDHQGTGASLFLSVDIGEAVKQMRFIFSGSIGGANECAEWIRALRDLAHLPEPEHEHIYSHEIPLQAEQTDIPEYDSVYLNKGPGHEPYSVEDTYENRDDEKHREESRMPGSDTKKRTEKEEREEVKDFIPTPSPHNIVSKPKRELKQVRKQKGAMPDDSEIIDGETGEGVEICRAGQSRERHQEDTSVADEIIEITDEEPDFIHHEHPSQSEKTHDLKGRDSESEPDTLIIHVEKPIFRQHRLRRSYQNRSSGETDIRPCSICGVKIPIKARFCPSCGSEQG